MWQKVLLIVLQITKKKKKHTKMKNGRTVCETLLDSWNWFCFPFGLIHSPRWPSSRCAFQTVFKSSRQGSVFLNISGKYFFFFVSILLLSGGNLVSPKQLLFRNGKITVIFKQVNTDVVVLDTYMCHYIINIWPKSNSNEVFDQRMSDILVWYVIRMAASEPISVTNYIL